MRISSFIIALLFAMGTYGLWALLNRPGNISGMTKKAKKAALKGSRVSPRRSHVPTRVEGYEVLGRTPDGVLILKPKLDPEHFSWEQLNSAVASIRKRG